MEENIAILMADLSGYTALTEVHGAVSAADLIDKYVEIVQNCLVEDCMLKERTGDEVMIVSSSPDSLLATANMIMMHTSKEEYFLQIHGGLHYGKVLNRNNSYFGTTINVTARIAAKAEPGTFWCSGDFADALNDKSSLESKVKSKCSFKNVKEEQEIVQVFNTQSGAFEIDPVCRMLILDKNTSITHPDMENLHFCSHACLDIYRNTGETNHAAVHHH